MLLSQFSQELKKPSFGISKERRTKEKEEVSQKMKKVLEQLKMS